MVDVDDEKKWTEIQTRNKKNHRWFWANKKNNSKTMAINLNIHIYSGQLFFSRILRFELN